MANERGTIKVLHVLSGDLWGGAEAQVFLLAKALLARSCQVHLLLFNQNEPYHRYVEAGIPCEYISETLGLPQLLKRSVEFIKIVSPDLLVAHGYKESFVACAAATSLRVPWVSTFHGLTENYRGWAKIRMSFYSAIHRLVSSISAATVVAVSHALRRDLGIAQAKTRVIFNAASLEEDNQDGLALPELKHPAVLVVGRLVPVKRVDLALDAFSLFAQTNSLATLYIVGEGPEEKRLKVQAKQLGLSQTVQFLGFQPKAATLISKADLLLLASDSEGIPSVVLEAAAHAVPVVSTAVGGIPEVFQALPSYPVSLVEKGNVFALSQAISRMLGFDRATVDTAGIRANFDKNFSPEVASSRHIEMYEELLRKHF